MRTRVLALRATAVAVVCVLTGCTSTDFDPSALGKLVPSSSTSGQPTPTATDGSSSFFDVDSSFAVCPALLDDKWLTALGTDGVKSYTLWAHGQASAQAIPQQDWFVPYTAVTYHNGATTQDFRYDRAYDKVTQVGTAGDGAIYYRYAVRGKGYSDPAAGLSVWNVGKDLPPTRIWPSGLTIDDPLKYGLSSTIHVDGDTLWYVRSTLGKRELVRYTVSTGREKVIGSGMQLDWAWWNGGPVTITRNGGLTQWDPTTGTERSLDERLSSLSNVSRVLSDGTYLLLITNATHVPIRDANGEPEPAEDSDKADGAAASETPSGAESGAASSPTAAAPGAASGEPSNAPSGSPSASATPDHSTFTPNPSGAYDMHDLWVIGPNAVPKKVPLETIPAQREWRVINGYLISRSTRETLILNLATGAWTTSQIRPLTSFGSTAVLINPSASRQTLVDLAALPQLACDASGTGNSDGAVAPK